MPVVRHQLEGEAPDKPHLAAMLDEGGMWTALEPGTMMAIIEDPEKADKIFPLVLAKVTHKYLDFICACGRKDCTRRVRFVGNWKGWHPQSGQSKPTMQQAPDEG